MHNIAWKQGDLLEYFNFVGVDEAIIYIFEAIIYIFMVTTSRVLVECACLMCYDIGEIQFNQVQLLIWVWGVPPCAL